MKLEIRHRFTAEVLLVHEREGNTIKATVAAAVVVQTDPPRADLKGADFTVTDRLG